MANRFWRGTTSASWNNTNNWSLTSGGSTGVTVPTSSDVVTFDSSGNNACTIDGTTNNCLSLTVSAGYTSTITNNCTSLTIAGSVTLVTGATYTQTAGTWIINATSTITATSVTIPYPIQVNAFTVTLGGNLTTTGNITISGAATWNSNTWNINGGTFTVNSNIAGTTAIVLGTTGNITWTGSGRIDNSLTFNTSGTITLGATVTSGNGQTITYTSGTMVTTGSTLFAGFNTTFNTSGMTWNNIFVNANTRTFTLNSTLNATTIFTVNNPSMTWAGSFGFSVVNLYIGYPNSGGSSSLTLHSGDTYTVTGSIAVFGNGYNLNALSVVASTVNGTKANLTYTGTNTIDKMQIIGVSFTDIDASGGNTIYDVTSLTGTLTRVVNINSVTTGSYPPQTRASVSIS